MSQASERNDAVTYGREGAVGVMTLNRPDNRNSMTAEVLDAFEVAVAAARADGEARAVVVTGTGSCFSAGADFKAHVQRGAAELDPAERSFAMYQPFLGLLDVEVPVVAALNGHAVGGGFGLALLCDLRVASRSAKLGANFCRLGLAPGLGISYLLPRLVGLPRASELLYSGRLVTGEEAAAIGLVNQAAPPGEVRARALELAGAVAASAPLAVRATKRLLRRGLAEDIRAHAREEAAAQAATIATADFAEGVAALLGKRAPRFHGR
jgi:enoyl-CoA hydratase